MHQVVKVRLQVQHVGLASGTQAAPSTSASTSASASAGPGAPGHGARTLATGPWDCAKLVLRTEGVRGLFRGWGPLVARDVPFNSVFFGCYNAYSKVLAPLGRGGGGAPAGGAPGGDGEKAGPFKIWLAVGVRKCLCAWLCIAGLEDCAKACCLEPTLGPHPVPCPCALVPRVGLRVRLRGWCACPLTSSSRGCRRAPCQPHWLVLGLLPAPLSCPQHSPPPCARCTLPVACGPSTKGPARRSCVRFRPTVPCSLGECGVGVHAECAVWGLAVQHWLCVPHGPAASAPPRYELAMRAMS